MSASPFKAVRGIAQDKTVLESLQRRLEQVLLKHREVECQRQDAERMARDFEENGKRRIAELEKAHKAQVTELLQSKRSLHTNCENLKAKNTALIDELQAMTNAKHVQQEHIVDLTSRLRDVTDSCKTTAPKLMSLEVSNKCYLKKNADLCSTVARLDNDILEISKVLSDTEDELSLQRVRTKNAEEALGVKRDAFNAELASLRHRLSMVTTDGDDLERRIRKEYAEQLESIMEERVQVYESEKKRLLSDVKSTYDKKTKEVNAVLSRTKDSLALAQVQYNDLASQFEGLQISHKQSTENNILLESRLTALSKELREFRSLPSRLAKEKDQQIRDLERALETKDEENNMLTCIKVRLSSEIDTYKRLLNEEINRLDERKRSCQESVRGRRQRDSQTFKKAKMVEGVHRLTPQTVTTLNTRIPGPYIVGMDQAGSRLILGNDSESDENMVYTNRISMAVYR